MKILSVIFPLLVFALIIYASVKKVSVFSAFTSGASTVLPLVFELFPVILAVFLMAELFEQSGLSQAFMRLISPVFNLLGIPTEIANLVILKPFSGSGSLALLTDIFTKYGTTGYVPLCAIAVFGSSETTFYVSAVYYSLCKNKNATKMIIISLVANLISTCFACFICRLLS